MAHKKAGGSGRDHTLFAKADGLVSYSTHGRLKRTYVSVTAP